MTGRKPSYEELAENCARLETRVGEFLVLQRDLNDATARVDDELARFQAIQAFIEKSLTARSDGEFYDFAMEAIIEAFQFEVSVFLRPSEDPNVLIVAGSFGIENPPDELAFDIQWIEDGSMVVTDPSAPVLVAWDTLGLHEAIVCPVRDDKDCLTGLILGGQTRENHDLYAPVSAGIGAAFTVMARQIASILSSRTLNLELVEQNRRLEMEHARQIVMQRDLIRAKDQVDDELMRFKSIQEYIARSLNAESDDEFFRLTLEAIIEAFELEIAVFAQVRDGAAGRLKVVSQFGLDNVPETLPYSTDWFPDWNGAIIGADNDMLDRWSELNLASAIACPFHDEEDELGGVIVAGITVDSMDFYEEIRSEILTPYSVLVRQAGSLWINRQLNAEILAHNRRLSDLTKSYSRFVPFQFLELLGRSSIEEIVTGDSALRDMSVLFADIRGFTSLSEQLGPTEIFIALNEFLATMEPLIAGNNGFINQYLGDAIMALFPDSADGALRCAGAMLETQLAFNREREAAGKRPILFGLGINSGPLTIGALGGGERLDSNVIGDTVNLASRAEGLTKIYGVPAIFTEATHTLLQSPESLRFREIDRVIVKGRANANTIYELLHSDLIAKRAGADRFTEALCEYRDGYFSTAADILRDCLLDTPDDPVARLYVTRCENFIAAPPENWDGVWRLEEKR